MTCHLTPVPFIMKTHLKKTLASQRMLTALLLAMLIQFQPANAAEEFVLIERETPTSGWRFDNGQEFPGARGGLFSDDTVEAQYRPAIRLDGDFTGGGNYVQVGRSLPKTALDSLSFWIKAPVGMEQLTIRLIDSTGQCHQFNLKTESHGKWQRMLFPVAQYFEKAGTSASVELVKRYEGWGGAKDGKWHNPAKDLYILAGKHAFGETLKGSLWIANAKILSAAPKTALGADDVYRESFDASAGLPEGWKVEAPTGSVAISSDSPFQGAQALRIARTEMQLNEDVTVIGAAFVAAPGPWSLAGATRSALHSPDNSFAVRLNIEVIDSTGNVVEKTTIVDQTGNKNWKPFAKQVDFPKGTEKARFTATVHKTHGTCDIDALSATPLEVKAKEKIVERIVIGNAVVGNLFLPENEVTFNLEVRTEKPLPADSLKASLTVTDYWGAEQAAAQSVALEPSGQADKRFRYVAKVTLLKEALVIGKYYELHVALTPEGFEEASEYSGFARLPVAESRQYPAEQSPFTIRNWDSRIGDYFKLASRIGLRNIGTWGGSGWDRIRDLGDNWYGGPSGVSQVERNGWKDITEEQLRKNALDFMTKHKDTESLTCIMLGNEPNERPERVAEKVRAYQIAYEALKSVKPDVTIVTTSVPALETFFEAGYHQYTDVYDFHVYETYEGVRNAIRRYRELGKKYGAEKPIWCTELGLNSQGQTRHAVALEVVKKITAFFAEGGANVSWFTIMYPDNNGKARGTSGDSHNTFDCQYSQYNPRLDAIMYYNMINGITIKKFVDEVQYENGIQSYLFRDADGDCFHVLWKEGTRVDFGIPLPGVTDARLIRIDGSSSPLKPANGRVTLGLSSEPVMLRYRQKTAAPLSRQLASPSIEVPVAQALTILKGQSREITVTGKGLKASDLATQLPPRWIATFRQEGTDAVICVVTAPAETSARTGRVMLRRADDSAEIILPLAIMSPISIEVFASSRNAAGEPTIHVLLQNNGTEQASLDWTVELTESFPIKGGVFHLNAPISPEAYLKGDTEGKATLVAGAVREATVMIANSAEQTLYRVRINAIDEMGRKVVRERLVGGFATASRAKQPIVIDGKFDDEVWTKTEVQHINTAAAALRFGTSAPWRDVADLSAIWRCAWDDENLYLAVDVTDDVHHVQFSDGKIWNQDSLQFLFDPARTEVEKAGKYDYSLGVGTKGPQAWCHLSGHSSINEGAAPFAVASTPLPGSAGGMRYEVAIPWTSIAPFKPKAGANLGMTLIVNEDDGDGRIGFSGWFSGAHTKELDLVGDVILGE